MEIRSYHGHTGAPLEIVTGWGSVEVAFAEDGPATATVELPHDSAHLHRDSLFPGNLGALYEIDATDLGVPEVFLGRVRTQGGGQGPRTLEVAGPGSSWLARAAVPVSPSPSPQRTAALLRELVPRTPGLMLELGVLEDGAGGPVEMRGEPFWPWLLAVTQRRGEWPYLTAIARRPGLRLDLLTGGYRRDLTGVEAHALTHGVNCEVEVDFSLDPELEEMVLAGQAFLAGRGQRAARGGLPPTLYLGARDALTGPLAVGAARGALGGGQGAVVVDPGVVTRAGLEDQLAALLRRARVIPAVATAYDVAEAAWGLAPLDLVRVSYPGDPHGVWDRAIGRVLSCSYSLAPERALDVVLDLWARE